MLGAKVEHLLGFLNAAGVRTRNRATLRHNAERAKALLLWWQANKNQRTINLEQRKQLVYIDVRRGCVDNKVELAAKVFEGLWVVDRAIVGCAVAKRFIALAG